MLHVTKSLEQQHVVQTVDKVLYLKLLELKWSVEQYKDILIPCLRGLHIAMNFLGVIGRHVNGRQTDYHGFQQPMKEFAADGSLDLHLYASKRILLFLFSYLLIDGQALVMPLGNPPGIRTFGDYANTFANTVFKMGAKYQRIDVAFDGYQDNSIKAGTRTKREQRHRPVRHKIENDASVPLPSNCCSFMALE
ncbi:hypothetical protein LSH36_84g08067 [Paralvinella palmiformis]|uniref:Uncharacterized protein n=1 Tax=Paralvinella palmiformis TaxID=53620 RepID=A0AAD9K2K9_9ANNE|nr:hypothetical protein LSH36_84g08067 [Paralvinella palmiformis]